MAAKLFVGSLAWATTDDSLRQFFSQAGTVVSASVITDKFTGKSRGFGFVEMATEEEAEQAKKQLDGQDLDGRNITVNDARPQESNDRPRRFDNNRGGDNRGGRGGDRGPRRGGY